MQKKSGYGKVQSAWMRRVVSHKAGALAVHWVFQGMLHMDPTERLFKLGIDALLGFTIAALLSVWLQPWLGLGLGLLIAHSLNWVFNGQIYGVLKHFGGVCHTWEEYTTEVENLRQRIASQPHIHYAAAYGSLAREAWSPSSDLDVRLVRAPGLAGALSVCWFAASERARAFRRGFPLDLFVCDSYTSLAKMAERDTPVILGGSALQGR